MENIRTGYCLHFFKFLFPPPPKKRMILKKCSSKEIKFTIKKNAIWLKPVMPLKYLIYLFHISTER